MNPTLKAQFEAIIRDNNSVYTHVANEPQFDHERVDTGLDDFIDCMQRAYDMRQAEIDALQAKITQLSATILDYETKFDVIAENEGKRMVEFGEHIKGKCLLEAWGLETPNTTRVNIESINIKQLYTNFKRK